MGRVDSAAIKAAALDFIERNRLAFATLSDSIFYFGELGMQEHRSIALLIDILETNGFAIERNLSGFPTAALASWGTGSPVIALHTEFDANPDNSQQSGVTERAAIVPGAPGHCEGHNVNAAVMIAAAVAIKRAMEANALTGTLKVFCAPAEEQLMSRPYFVRDGHFDGVDVAFHDHILDEFRTDYGILQSAMVSAEFKFTGEAAHSAMSPWKGRDALDATVLMDVGMAQFREHFEPTTSAHRVITHGGDQPNVIPSRSSVWWYLRHSTGEGVRSVFERACRIAEGAAMMANCEMAVDVLSAVWPVRGNRILAEIVQRNIDMIGMPEWSTEEQAFSRELQRAAGVRQQGLRDAVTSLTGPAKQIAASNDSGDVSWVVPMTRIWFPGNVPNVPFHHWAGGAALATSIAHKGGIAGAKALAASVIDLLLEPACVDEVRESFRAELDGTVFRSLLPADKRPPLDLNFAAMERYRSQMEQHYVRQRPVFE